MGRRFMRGGYYGAPYASGSGCGCGCLSTIIMLAVAMSLFAFVLPASCMSGFMGGSHGEVTHLVSDAPSQTQTKTHTTSSSRQKLAAADCVESAQWIDDQAGWLENQDTVIQKMRSFYEATGVQPYLIIADQVNGTKDYSVSDVERYMRSRFDELFQDDGHLMLLFCEPYTNEYDPYLLVGSKAATVIDEDAENIIYEAIDYWYTDSSLNDDAYFARIFLASGDAIMNGTDFSEFG